MLVSVVQLRKRGAPIPRDEVIRARGVVGTLQLDVRRRYPNRPPVLIALLVDPRAPVSLLPPLDQAQVQRIIERGMLIVGMEQVEEGHRDSFRNYRQAWWCRPAHGVPDGQGIGYQG